MASLIESPQVALVSVPASSLFSLSRFMLPILGVTIGVSVGSTAGLTLALINAPNNMVAASSSDSAPASPANAVAATSVAMNAQPAPTTQSPADTVQPTANSAVAKSDDVSVSTATPVVKAHAPRTVQIALNRTPDAL